MFNWYFLTNEHVYKINFSVLSLLGLDEVTSEPCSTARPDQHEDLLGA